MKPVMFTPLGFVLKSAGCCCYKVFCGLWYSLSRAWRSVECSCGLTEGGFTLTMKCLSETICLEIGREICNALCTGPFTNTAVAEGVASAVGPGVLWILMPEVKMS
jgi:hypothetical protein